MEGSRTAIRLVAVAAVMVLALSFVPGQAHAYIVCGGHARGFCSGGGGGGSSSVSSCFQAGYQSVVTSNTSYLGNIVEQNSVQAWANSCSGNSNTFTLGSGTYSATVDPAGLPGVADYVGGWTTSDHANFAYTLSSSQYGYASIVLQAVDWNTFSLGFCAQSNSAAGSAMFALTMQVFDLTTGGPAVTTMQLPLFGSNTQGETRHLAFREQFSPASS